MVKRVLGVLGGGETPEPLLRRWVESADVVYAADSGANRLIRMGFQPVVVGDLDSFDPDLRGPETRVVHDPDPDRTDCDKLLRLAEKEGHSAVTLIDVEGDLLDHVLASLSSLAASGLVGRLALRRGIAWLLRKQWSQSVDLAPGHRVSLIPLRECRGVRLTGVEWEVHGLPMSPAGFLSVSNLSTGHVFASIEDGLAYLVVEFEPHQMPRW